jgi:hypothetical protein
MDGLCLLDVLYCHARVLASFPSAMPALLPPLELPSPSPVSRPRSQPELLFARAALSPAPPVCLASLKAPPATDHTAPQCPKSAYTLPSPALRRRPKPPSFALRRRRLAPRVECAPDPLPIHPFDKLPWIASMDRPIDNMRQNDLADLSLLPDDPFISRPTILPSGTGPIRRRKLSATKRSSLRVAPLEIHTTRGDDDLFHSASNLFPRHIPERPSTPMNVSRPDPAHITFRHLMPVIDDGLL